MSKKKCDACDGTGKVIDSNEGGERACSRCGGTGEVTVASDALEGPGQDGGGGTGGD